MVGYYAGMREAIAVVKNTFPDLENQCDALLLEIVDMIDEGDDPKAHASGVRNVYQIFNYKHKTEVKALRSARRTGDVKDRVSIRANARATARAAKQEAAATHAHTIKTLPASGRRTPSPESGPGPTPEPETKSPWRTR